MERSKTAAPTVLPVKVLPRTAPALDPAKQIPHWALSRKVVPRTLARWAPVSRMPAASLPESSLLVTCSVVPRALVSSARAVMLTPVPVPA